MSDQKNEPITFIFKRYVKQAIAIQAQDYEEARERVKSLKDDQWAIVFEGLYEGTPCGVLNGLIITPSDIDPNQPHIQVTWDENYWAVGNANYEELDHLERWKESCKLFYIPYRVIQVFGSLKTAFTFLFQKEAIHIANYEGETFFHADGTIWPEEEYDRFPGLEDMEDELTQ